MGHDKAELMLGGKSFLERAVALANACAATRTVVLGKKAHPLGVADEHAHAGPAAAIVSWLSRQPGPTRILALPVDMPLLGRKQIQHLLAQETPAYFHDLYLPFSAVATPTLTPTGARMKDLLSALGAHKLMPAPAWQDALVNINDQATYTWACARASTSSS